MDLSKEDFSDRACSSWLDGAAIIIACLIVGNITAWNEMAKEKQFRALQAQQDDCDVTVKRNGIEVDQDTISRKMKVNGRSGSRLNS